MKLTTCQLFGRGNVQTHEISGNVTKCNIYGVQVYSRFDICQLFGRGNVQTHEISGNVTTCNIYGVQVYSRFDIVTVTIDNRHPLLSPSTFVRTKRF